jgi:hypothetical protein
MKREDEKMKRNIPDAQYLRMRLVYQPETGVLTWAEWPTSKANRSINTWNARFAGKPAGRVNRGRRFVRIDGIDYVVSRVVWTMHTGQAPQHDIDHINGHRLDDRFHNLRDVERSINNRNKAARPGASGYVGVQLHRKTGTWLARMYLNNKPICIGYFKTAEDAFQARVAAQAPYGFTDRHTYQ